MLAFLRDFIADAPDELGLMANLRLAPPLPVFPTEVHGKPIVGLIVTWAGDIDDGEEVLRPLRALGTPLVDAITHKPYVAHQKMLDPAVPHGRHYYWKSHRLGPLTDDVIAIICEHLDTISSPLSSVPIFSFGGAMARVPEDATAFPHRDASHDINIVGSWLPEQAGDADRHRAWVRGFFDDLAPHSRGVYVNFTSDDAAATGGQAYRPAQLDRLRRLKAAYDPTNFFYRNANIVLREGDAASTASPSHCGDSNAGAAGRTTARTPVVAAPWTDESIDDDALQRTATRAARSAGRQSARPRHIHHAGRLARGASQAAVAPPAPRWPATPPTPGSAPLGVLEHSARRELGSAPPTVQSVRACLWWRARSRRP